MGRPKIKGSRWTIAILLFSLSFLLFSGMALTKVIKSAIDSIKPVLTLPVAAAISSTVVSGPISEMTGKGVVRKSIMGCRGSVTSRTVPRTGSMKSLMKEPRSRPTS